MKTYKIIHLTANIIAFGLLGAFLVYFLISYDGLPERIGVHFSPVDGQFDVYSYKIFGFYPFAAGGVLLAVFSLLTLAVKKIKKLGLKVDEKGDMVLRCAAGLLLDLMKLTWAVFFSYWTYCVVHQKGMGDGTFLDVFRVFFILILLASPVLFSRIQEKYRISPRDNEKINGFGVIPESPKKLRIMHIAANILSFGLLGGFLVYFLISYGSLPERIGVHFGSSGEFDVYSYKVFGFYPFAAGFGLLLIFCLLSLAAKKIKRIGMNIDEKGEVIIRMIISECIDSLKLIWSVFFAVWANCVITQTGMDTTFMSILMVIFLALFPVTAAVVIITARRHGINDAEDTKGNKEVKNDNSTRN